MAKTHEEIVADIAAATAEMNAEDATEFLDKLKDEIETMIDMIEPEEEEEEETGSAGGD